MSNSPKQMRRLMFAVFAVLAGVVACDSATAPEQSAAEVFRAVDSQVDEADLMRDLEIERLRSTGSGSKAQAE